MKLPSKRVWMGGSIAMVLSMLVVCGMYLLQQQESRLTDPSTKEHHVVLTDEGFDPAQITIRKGDTIIFTTTGDTPFWPASSFHPTHALYALFDPQRPILPGDEWSFEFDTPGQWGYHDHLDPQKTGEVEVLLHWELKRNKEVPCDQLKGTEQMRCFDQTLRKQLNEQGIDSAFTYFREIYDTYPSVASECHDWTHRLGEREYELYTQGKEVVLKEEASFCGYGYFHGFINAMVEDTQSLYSATEFCARAGSAVEGMEDSCIHGIGHSVATLALEGQVVWGDVNEVFVTASKECERLYPQTLSICLDGMFHELYGSIGRGDYGLAVDEYVESNDLFFYCRELEDPLAESCYAEFIKLWPYFLGEDKKVVMEYVKTSIPEVLRDSPRVLHTLARSFIEVDIATGVFQESVDACAEAEGALSGECIEGLAIGFVTHGKPGSMHEEGFAFCNEYYQGGQQRVCIEKMLQELLSRYTPEQLAVVCQKLKEDHKDVMCMHI